MEEIEETQLLRQREFSPRPFSTFVSNQLSHLAGKAPSKSVY